MKLELLTVYNDCVPCIRAALVPNYNIGFKGKVISDFAFAFVAPLTSYYNNSGI